MSGIMMMLMAAKGGGAINPIPISSFGDLAIDPADAQATLTFDTDGSGTMVGLSNTPFEWHDPVSVGVGASFWIRLTVDSGTIPSGSATGSWLQLSVARSWSLSQTSVGSKSGVYTLEIALDSGGASVVASKSITMTASVEL